MRRHVLPLTMNVGVFVVEDVHTNFEMTAQVGERIMCLGLPQLPFMVK